MRKLYIAGFVLVLFVAVAMAQGGVPFVDGLRYNLSAQTVADNGSGTAATGTVTVLKSYVELTCSDANGCDMTLSETGAREGMVLVVVNVSANTCNFADTAGVSETAGTFAAGQYDVISYVYIGDRWVETARSNN